VSDAPDPHRLAGIHSALLHGRDLSAPDRQWLAAHIAGMLGRRHPWRSAARGRRNEMLRHLRAAFFSDCPSIHKAARHIEAEAARYARCRGQRDDPKLTIIDTILDSGPLPCNRQLRRILGT
jgi:hypothetical protein